MTRRSIALATAAGCAAILAIVAYAPRVLRAQQSQPLPIHQVPGSKDGGVVVMLCDGKTSMEVKGLKTGESMSHAQAVEVTRELMAQWQRQHPNEKWQMAQTDQSAPSAPASYAASVGGGKAPSKGLQQADTYASFTDRD